MLEQTEGASFVFEPDNHFMFPYAFKAKRGLTGGYYPQPEGRGDASLYENLWLNAFALSRTGFSLSERARRKAARSMLRAAGERNIWRSFNSPKSLSPRLRLAEALAVPERPIEPTPHVLVKSVYVPNAAEWVADLVGAQVLIVLRDLRDTVSSWVQLGWLGTSGEDELAASDPALQDELRRRFRVPPVSSISSPIGQVTWLLGLFTLCLEEAARRHPEWQVARHEDVVRNLPDSLRDLSAALGLHWTDRAESAVAASRQAGHGFETRRLPEQVRDVWKSRLSAGQAAEVDAVLGMFPPGAG